MATAYASATGKLGVSSVTCGPGLTQIMTALATAAQARIPLMVFSGESPMHAAWYNQHIDQAPLVTATGAQYVSAHSPRRMLTQLRDAFHLLRTERRPVVFGVPLDLQQEVLTDVVYTPSTAFIPDVGPMPPHPDDVARAADRIVSSERIVLIGGRGVVRSGARQDCEALADRSGALLASTLPVRGLFDHHPASIGVAGGFSHEVAREKFGEADLVVAVGASLAQHMVDSGRLFPNAAVIQVDPHPVGLRQGRRAADLYVRGDARMGVVALTSALERRTLRAATGWREDGLSARMAGPADSAFFPPEEGVIDPRQAMSALDRAIPKDWEIVNASGHCSFFTAQMRGRSSDNFLAIREFGAIGNGLSYAVGLAVARPDRPVVLIDGDGGFLMHVQELETIRRYGLKILVCILNDGAYGSEVHKLRADGIDDHGAVFGRGDLGAIARGFGVRGRIVDDLATLPALIEEHAAGETSEVWDIHISDRIASPAMRRLTAGRAVAGR